MWVDDAACRGHDLRLFFPVSGTSPQAKLICDGCPVRVECLVEALGEPDDDWGIRGGLSPGERARVRRKRRRVG